MKNKQLNKSSFAVFNVVISMLALGITSSCGRSSEETIEERTSQQMSIEGKTGSSSVDVAKNETMTAAPSANLEMDSSSRQRLEKYAAIFSATTGEPVTPEILFSRATDAQMTVEEYVEDCLHRATLAKMAQMDKSISGKTDTDNGGVEKINSDNSAATSPSVEESELPKKRLNPISVAAKILKIPPETHIPEAAQPKILEGARRQLGVGFDDPLVFDKLKKLGIVLTKEDFLEDEVDQGPKPDPEELMRKALERLEAKRRGKQEAESAAKASAEEDLRTSREKTAKELIAGMVSIPGARFKMGKTEVTGAQWAGIMGSNPSVFKYDDHPVDSVSWDDVQKFLKTVNALPTVQSAGIHFRLPSPEEWEYACRAGSTGNFGLLPNGYEGNASTMAWYISNTGNGDTTKPVGKKSPNAWGLYDMHGNVWEFTSKMDADYAEARGGCFGNWDSGVTANSTSSIGRNEQRRWTGFRLCADGGGD